MGSGVSAIEQTMIVAVSTFHFGPKTRLPTHKDKCEFETQVSRLPCINAVCAADFQDDSALLIFVDGSPSQRTTTNRHISLYT